MRLKNIFMIVGISILVVGCGSDGMTEQERFLKLLEGTWVGTAEDVLTVEGSNRINMNLALPADGKPALAGLTGTIWFGERSSPPEVNPDDPGVGDYAYFQLWIDGFSFELVDMAIVDNRLMAGFNRMNQWGPFCEAQTEIYTWENSPGYYSCLPDGGASCGPLGPNGEECCVFEGLDGEDIFITPGKMELCMQTCRCEVDGCALAEEESRAVVELDLTVDVENGLMLGDGLGRIEAVRCEEGFHLDESGTCIPD